MGMFRCGGGGSETHVHSETVSVSRYGSFTVNVDFKPMVVAILQDAVSGKSYGSTSVAIRDVAYQSTSLGGTQYSRWNGVTTWGDKSVTVAVPYDIVSSTTIKVYVIG